MVKQLFFSVYQWQRRSSLSTSFRGDRSIRITLKHGILPVRTVPYPPSPPQHNLPSPLISPPSLLSIPPSIHLLSEGEGNYFPREVPSVSVGRFTSVHRGSRANQVPQHSLTSINPPRPESCNKCTLAGNRTLDPWAHDTASLPTELSAHHS